MTVTRKRSKFRAEGKWGLKPRNQKSEFCQGLCNLFRLLTPIFREGSISRLPGDFTSRDQKNEGQKVVRRKRHY